MAQRKPTRKGPHASELRTGWPTAAILRDAAQSLQEMSGDLRQLADQLDEGGIKKVKIDGDKKFEAGVMKVRGYIAAVSKGIIDHNLRN